MPSMTTRDQSREGVSGPTSSLATPKHTLRVGAWNVRTMYETGKTAQVFKEMERYRLNILGLSEISMDRVRENHSWNRSNALLFQAFRWTTS